MVQWVRIVLLVIILAALARCSMVFEPADLRHIPDISMERSARAFLGDDAIDWLCSHYRGGGRCHDAP